MAEQISRSWRRTAQVVGVYMTLALGGAAVGSGIPAVAQDAGKTDCPDPARTPVAEIPVGCVFADGTTRTTGEQDVQPVSPAPAPASGTSTAPAKPAPATPQSTPEPDAPAPAAGDSGPTGATSISGATGATAATSATGTTGTTGATGTSGTSGTTGATGPTGSVSPAGTTGSTGSGPTGATAPAVRTGPTETTGKRGATGTSGASGPAGSTGPTGSGKTVHHRPLGGVVETPVDLQVPAPTTSETKVPGFSKSLPGTTRDTQEPESMAGETVDWGSVQPLSLPAFGSADAATFPGPRYLLPIYAAASLQYGIPWSVLASINEIETGFGRNQGPSSAGAIGWMQFMPSTWATYGVDADQDGVRNPADPVDAIFAAAKYLRAAGGAENIGRAVLAYNHAGWYEQKVLSRAGQFQAMAPDLLASLTASGYRDARGIKRASGSTGLFDRAAAPKTIGEVMLLSDSELQRFVLADQRLSIYACGRSDISGGVVDRRVLEVLEYLAYDGLHATVSALRCGHSYLTTSGNVSEHSSGSAVDIAAINGTPIVGHQGAGSITDRTIRAILRLNSGAERPHQIISLMTFRGAANTLALADHYNHIHVGFRPARPVTA
jgi:hypothetical protein